MTCTRAVRCPGSLLSQAADPDGVVDREQLAKSFASC